MAWLLVAHRRKSSDHPSFLGCIGGRDAASRANDQPTPAGTHGRFLGRAHACGRKIRGSRSGIRQDRGHQVWGSDRENPRPDAPDLDGTETIAPWSRVGPIGKGSGGWGAVRRESCWRFRVRRQPASAQGPPPARTCRRGAEPNRPHPWAPIASSPGSPSRSWVVAARAHGPGTGLARASVGPGNPTCAARQTQEVAHGPGVSATAALVPGGSRPDRSGRPRASDMGCGPAGTRPCRQAALPTGGPAGTRPSRHAA